MNNFTEHLGKLWQPELRWPLAGIVLLAFVLGYFFAGSPSPAASAEADHLQEQTNQARIWTCSMHPQIRQPQAGQCPICGMDLIPVAEDGADDLGPRQLKLSDAARKLAQIQTAVVERKYVATEIRMVGKIAIDETRLKYISAYVPGRIDRLFVDYTGTQVRKGDHLAELYSPSLISAQEELLQARTMLDKLDQGAAPGIRGSMQSSLEAVREKLRRWGLTGGQIAAIEKQSAPSDHLTIFSPISGIVIQRNATEGMYIDTGTRIYTVADLSYLWVKMDAYESDLEWLRYGQAVEFTAEAYPGEIFTGKIAFIDPILDPQTRTVKVRVNIKNPQMKLKPEMFVRAMVRSRLSLGGKIMDPELAGKWISPMHPEIVKDGPGNCDVCGMTLVRAEKLGYVSANEIEGDAPLIIPATAPLRTGRRAVVYVAANNEQNIFEGRDVVLGPRSGDYYVVHEGLHEGERVVTNGNFKLDSDLQIRAKPSMMSPEGGVPAPGHDHGGHAARTPVSAAADIPLAFRRSLNPVAGAYFAVQFALSRDNLDNAHTAATSMLDAMKAVDMSLLQGDAHMHWMDLLGKIQASAGRIGDADKLSVVRPAFEALSEELYHVLKEFGTSAEKPVNRFFCPMAFDNKGAYWLDDGSEVENPYFGSAMFKCGEVVEAVLE